MFPIRNRSKLGMVRDQIVEAEAGSCSHSAEMKLLLLERCQAAHRQYSRIFDKMAMDNIGTYAERRNLSENVAETIVETMKDVLNLR